MPVLNINNKVGGGGFEPVGVLKPFSVEDVKIVANDGAEWLRTGYLETDIPSYPDAVVSPPLDLGLGVDFFTASEMTGATVSGLGFDKINSEIYAFDTSDYTCKVYTPEGVYQRTTASLTATSGEVSFNDICVDSGSLFAIYLGVVHEFNLDGTYVGALNGTFTLQIPIKFYHDKQNSITYGMYRSSSSNYLVILDHQTGIQTSFVYYTLNTSDNGAITMAGGLLYLSKFNTSAGTQRAMHVYKPKGLSTTVDDEVYDTLYSSITTSERVYGMAFDVVNGRMLCGRSTKRVSRFANSGGVGNPISTNLENSGVHYYTKIKNA